MTTRHHTEGAPAMGTATVDLTEAKVTRLPDCDICHDGTVAAYDAAVNYMGRNTWAMVCEPHFKKHGFGLGMGRGQRLVLVTR
jgi:hypothetical protein